MRSWECGVRNEGSVVRRRDSAFRIRHSALKLAASPGFAPGPSGSKPGMLRVTPRGSELMEPEVVATSPCPGKNRMPVCCGFDSLKMVLAAGSAPALATRSTSCLCVGLREQRGWSLPPVLPRQDRFTKGIRRLLQGGKVAVSWHSQSPVPPRTQRAYETHLSAGSTAMMPHGHPIGAPTRSCTGLTRLPSECIADNALGAVID